MDLSKANLMILMSKDTPYYGTLLTLRALEVDIGKIVSLVDNTAPLQHKCGLLLYVFYDDFENYFLRFRPYKIYWFLELFLRKIRKIF